MSSSLSKAARNLGCLFILGTVACASASSPVSHVVRVVPSDQSATPAGPTASPSPQPTVVLVPAQRPKPALIARSDEGSVADLIREIFGRHGAKAVRVASCESGLSATAVSKSGKFRGLWQADRDFWRSYGGLRFASRPELASAYEQTLVAYAGFQARSWTPWPRCGRR